MGDAMAARALLEECDTRQVQVAAEVWFAVMQKCVAGVRKRICRPALRGLRIWLVVEHSSSASC